MRLEVDWPRCDAHAVCAELLPEVVSLDPWGYPVVERDIPSGLERHARRARELCPALALLIDRRR